MSENQSLKLINSFFRALKKNPSSRASLDTYHRMMSGYSMAFLHELDKRPEVEGEAYRSFYREYVLVSIVD